MTFISFVFLSHTHNSWIKTLISIAKGNNGQIWKEVGGRLNYIPKGDLKATIKSKSVGSYMLSLNNGKTTVRGLRVRRVE